MVKEKLEGLLDKAADVVRTTGELAQETYRLIEKDISNATDSAYTRVSELVDKAVENEDLRNFGRIPFEYASQGKDAVVEHMQDAFNMYNGKLDEKVQETPDIVGFWDGFANAYVGSSANRRPRSKVYQAGVKIGKGVGFASSILAFAPTSLGRVALTTLPVTSRGAKYLLDRISDAKDEVDSK